MGLDPSAHMAARSAFNRAEWRAGFSLRYVLLAWLQGGVETPPYEQSDDKRL